QQDDENQYRQYTKPKPIARPVSMLLRLLITIPRTISLKAVPISTKPIPKRKQIPV
ncbi:unnamed protein product, partial [Rotaria magnacalcarata]